VDYLTFSMKKGGRMVNSTVTNSEAIEPTTSESLLAKESSQKLARLLGGLEEKQHNSVSGTAPAKIEIRLDGETEVVALPTSALQFLNEILTQIAQGNGISIIPQQCELTTVRAAEVLNVSRPHLISLLEKGDIPYRKVGTHRRVLMKDIMHYKQELQEKRQGALRQLSELSEEIGFDD
jgi:excisionase family DNA binding protein